MEELEQEVADGVRPTDRGGRGGAESSALVLGMCSSVGLTLADESINLELFVNCIRCSLGKKQQHKARLKQIRLGLIDCMLLSPHTHHMGRAAPKAVSTDDSRPFHRSTSVDACLYLN